MAPLKHLVPGLALLLGTAHAAAGVTWICGLSADATRIVCVADADPIELETADVTPTASVRGTTFPLDPRRVYTVDLWSPASDLDFVAQLARATICFRSPDCKVVLARPVAAAHPRV